MCLFFVSFLLYPHQWICITTGHTLSLRGRSVHHAQDHWASVTIYQPVGVRITTWKKKAIISSFRNLKPVVLYVLQYLARGQSPHIHEKRPDFFVSDSESKLQPTFQCENHHIEKKAIISSFSTLKPGVSYVFKYFDPRRSPHARGQNLQNPHIEKKAIISSFRELKPVVLYVLQYLARGQSPHVHEYGPEFPISDSESKLLPAFQRENHHFEKKARISFFRTQKPVVSYVLKYFGTGYLTLC